MPKVKSTNDIIIWPLRRAAADRTQSTRKEERGDQKCPHTCPGPPCLSYFNADNHLAKGGLHIASTRHQ